MTSHYGHGIGNGGVPVRDAARCDIGKHGEGNIMSEVKNIVSVTVKRADVLDVLLPINSAADAIAFCRKSGTAFAANLKAWAKHHNIEKPNVFVRDEVRKHAMERNNVGMASITNDLQNGGYIDKATVSKDGNTKTYVIRKVPVEKSAKVKVPVKTLRERLAAAGLDDAAIAKVLAS